MRLVYGRGELVKYVSHLDFVKVFERALRRAEIEVAFSQGFNPRMQLVFGNPLPVGYTSSFELLDVTFARPYDTDFIVERLNSFLPGDIRILKAEELQKPCPSILQSFGFSEYEAGIIGLGEGDGKRIADAYKNSETVFALKRSKSGEKNVDIKPMIRSFEISGDRFHVVTVTGQEGNLRPELAFTAVSKTAGLEGCELSRIHKISMFR